MLNTPCRVLLIEDEPDDIAKIKNILENIHSPFFERGFKLTYTETLSAAKQILPQQEFDVILLDLMLPDSRHMNSLEELQGLVSGVPIIVQTALEDEVVAVRALEMGACGYLPKIVAEGDLLLYAIRNAIERQWQLANLEQFQQQQQKQEVDILESLLSDFPSFNSQYFNSLQQRMPDVFEELRLKYRDLLEYVVKEKIYKIEYDTSDRIDVLIEQLGYLQAIPKDLIILHTLVLKQKQKDLGQRKSRVYTIEGRYFLLELMGKLAAYYRKYYIGLNKINLASSYQDITSAD